MSLNHEFILVSMNDESSPYYYENYVWDDGNILNKDKSKINKLVAIPDGIILYIIDSLKWIPTINPNTRKWGYGLNYHGKTIINRHKDHNGSILTRNIFNSWADLFGNSPDKLLLTGQYSWIENDTTKGQYEKLEYDRNEIINSLKSIAVFAEQVSLNNDQLLHIGI